MSVMLEENLGFGLTCMITTSLSSSELMNFILHIASLKHYSELGSHLSIDPSSLSDS
jgi:hypothetical protein